MDLKRHHRTAVCTVLLLATVVAGAAVVFTGCGNTGDQLRPVMTSPADEEIGEVVVPVPIHKVPSPREAAVQYQGRGLVRITWNSGRIAYDTIIARNGVDIGRVNSLAGQYTDDLTVRPPKTVAYSVRFVSGSLQSQPVELPLEIWSTEGGVRPPEGGAEPGSPQVGD